MQGNRRNHNFAISTNNQLLSCANRISNRLRNSLPRSSLFTKWNPVCRTFWRCSPEAPQPAYMDTEYEHVRSSNVSGLVRNGEPMSVSPLTSPHAYVSITTTACQHAHKTQTSNCITIAPSDGLLTPQAPCVSAPRRNAKNQARSTQAAVTYSTVGSPPNTAAGVGGPIRRSPARFHFVFRSIVY